MNLTLGILSILFIVYLVWKLNRISNGCIHKWEYHYGLTMICYECKKCKKKIWQDIFEEPPI